MKTIHQRKKKTVLRFSPTAWAKLLCLRDAGDTEVCGFGITGANDLLLVEDIVLVKQECTWASAELDDASVADFFDDQVDAGRKPEQFSRIFIHTHPGGSPEPSGTDEETFTRVFGRNEWAVMFILARQGECYARLRFNVGPGAELDVPVEVDYRHTFGPSEEELWYDEHAANVFELEIRKTPLRKNEGQTAPMKAVDEEDWHSDAWYEYADFDLTERRFEHDHFW